MVAVLAVHQMVVLLAEQVDILAQVEMQHPMLLQVLAAVAAVDIMQLVAVAAAAV
jgi:hypothetical protein